MGICIFSFRGHQFQASKVCVMHQNIGLLTLFGIIRYYFSFYVVLFCIFLAILCVIKWSRLPPTKSCIPVPKVRIFLFYTYTHQTYVHTHFIPDSFTITFRWSCSNMCWNFCLAFSTSISSSCSFFISPLQLFQFSLQIAFTRYDTQFTGMHIMSHR